MDTGAIDRANVGLMLVSAVTAFFFPFELFLFSYAVLGPLHYLTEINWLHKKKYFSRANYDYLLLLGACVLMLALTFFSFDGAASGTLFAKVLIIAFIGAIIMVTVEDPLTRTLLFLVLMFLALALPIPLGILIIVAVLVPTIAHVFFFTGCFILNGALKSKSRWGLISFATFILCALALLLITTAPSTTPVVAYVRNVYALFAPVNLTLLEFLRIPITNSYLAIFDSAIGLAVMRFIAYAYTYHYLNWFSKTKLLRWHKVSRTSLISILLLWALAIGLYAYNYSVGFEVLYFLSLLHVLLEFPLDQRTFISLYNEIRLAGIRGTRALVT